MESSLKINRLVQGHLRSYPAMQVQDVYKLLYQTCMGIGHLVSSREGALVGILREMAEAPDVPWVEPLWENISAVGAVGRVNLRRFRDRKLDPGILADALFRFARTPPGDACRLACCWASVGRLIDEGELGFGLDEYMAFTARVKADGYPAVHHSRAYAEAYRPAYRILSQGLFMECFPGEDWFSVGFDAERGSG